MIKKTVVYEDFNGVTREEDFYFNLTTTELMKLESDVPGGFAALLEGIIKSNNAVGVYQQLRYILSRSYGIKSEDGRRFEKDPKYFEDFETTEAYSNLIESLINNPDEMNAFIEGIMPKRLMKQANDIMDQFETREEAVEYIRLQSVENQKSE